MKYNIGDKVVKEDQLEYLYNPYWKKDKRASLIKTVTEATENLFTIYNDKGYCNSTIENGMSCGANNYLIYHQESGKCYNWCSSDRLLHLDKDKDYIRHIIETIGVNQLNKDVSRMEAEIKSKKYWIAKYKEEYDKDLRINRELLELE